MKFLVILFSFFIYANALEKEFIADIIKKVKSIGEVCVPETSASQADVNTLIAHRIPESHEGKCLILCFQKHFHLLNEDGSINAPGAMEAIEPIKSQNMDTYNKFLQVFKTCESTPTDADPCIYAAKLAECGISEGKKLGLTDLIVLELE